MTHTLSRSEVNWSHELIKTANDRTQPIKASFTVSMIWAQLLLLPPYLLTATSSQLKNKLKNLSLFSNFCAKMGIGTLSRYLDSTQTDRWQSLTIVTMWRQFVDKFDNGTLLPPSGCVIPFNQCVHVSLSFIAGGRQNIRQKKHKIINIKRRKTETLNIQSFTEIVLFKCFCFIARPCMICT